jgi:hypothetical protein
LYNLKNSTINPSTICSQCKKNNINPVVAQGTSSLMAAVEPYLIAIILQLAQMRSPIDAIMGLHLANSMIQGKAIAKAIMATQAKQKKQQAMKLQELPSSLLSSSSTLTDHSSTSGSTAAASDNTNSGQYQQTQQESCRNESS